ncbi:hypothetical protein BDZ91DRAFT_731373 [Kalaharituber pfeilii]|nr:hypothetical protein BDZ91DRAFT_731373 [Kalaharituber pfeilii]
MMRYLEMQDISPAGAPSSFDGEAHQQLVGDGVGDDYDAMIGGDESDRATAYSSSHSNVDYPIQGPDALTPDALGGGPPRTRPPSPVNPEMGVDTNRSDPDFARAIRLSLETDYNNDYDSRWGNQETGITGAHSTPAPPYFGPATRPSYDPEKWAVATIPVTHEIYLDPVHPGDRQRKDKEPAFFKPSSDGYNLGPALAILHSIPAARTALLAPIRVLDDYGYNERWWSGESIEASRISTIVENEVPEPDPSEVVVEVQRLMAFLDNTKRGYGSVDSLAKMHSVYEEQQGEQLSSFFKKWSADIKCFLGLEDKHEPWPFTSCAVACDSNDQRDSYDEFQVLTVSVPNELADAPGANIYNALDPIIWPDGDENPGDVYLDYVADVFCISLKRDAPDVKGIGLDIPSDLYLNRYSKEYGPLVKEMKAQKLAVSCEIRNIEAREERLSRCRKRDIGGDDSSVETVKLLGAAIEHFENLRLPSEEKDSSGDISMEEKPDEHSSMTNQIREVLERLKVRLEELAQSKEKARETLYKLTTAFTSPETIPPDAPPLCRHSLRGIFVDLSTTFIKIRDCSDTESQEVGETWWCLSYPLQWEADANTAAYKVLKVAEKEVLDAAKYTGDGKVLLVYATEEAMAGTDWDGRLPEALKNFVERDNTAFLKELESAGDKGKRKRANWWTYNNSNNQNNNGDNSSNLTRISEDTTMEGHTQGVQQPPASPTEFLEGREADVEGACGPGVLAVPDEWYGYMEGGVREVGQQGLGQGLGGEGARGGEGQNAVWVWQNARGGWDRYQETGTGYGWEENQEVGSGSGNGEMTERRYDGNFVASDFKEGQKVRPEAMGFERITEDDEWDDKERRDGGGERSKGRKEEGEEDGDEEMEDVEVHTEARVEHVEFVGGKGGGGGDESPMGDGGK